MVLSAMGSGRSRNEKTRFRPLVQRKVGANDCKKADSAAGSCKPDNRGASRCREFLSCQSLLGPNRAGGAALKLVSWSSWFHSICRRINNDGLPGTVHGGESEGEEQIGARGKEKGVREVIDDGAVADCGFLGDDFLSLLWIPNLT